jgi:hypothetical protein
VLSTLKESIEKENKDLVWKSLVEASKENGLTILQVSLAHS